ncbi:MAG: phosphoribosylaminoimidazolesuccinocarboxamide synthase [Enterococcus lacertideformus]|uniref:Phosphoribosylaminoimidazole-succinocarboxamide synthase n=1 Tax=Enterococcus lacertideformus TaxID=2771493 RepID=A0A931AU65_9ENTE|nr:phosphoribosylaminoimidazolesuccinocarboxamide synthase [Enterococcus lacertideformus]
MEKKDLLYEGKAKKVYRTSSEKIVWIEYLDHATALNGLMKDQISGKGELNNQITSKIFYYLSEQGITNHFIQQLGKNEQLVERLEIIPLEVVVRNVAAGSFSKRLAIHEGQKLPTPIVEFYYKEDKLDDPFINDEHVLFLNIADEEEIHELKEQARKINQALIDLFQKIDLQLIDFKLEFGKTEQGKIVLGDEISPDTCRLWDMKTNEHMDKDVYRKKIGKIVPVYQEVLTRLTQLGC